MKHCAIILLFFIATLSYAMSDPTMPPDWSTESTPSLISKQLVISGIFTDQNRSIAIINGKSVRVGDFIQGYEITQITAHDVHIKNRQGTFVIPFSVKVITPVTNGLH